MSSSSTGSSQFDPKAVALLVDFQGTVESGNAGSGSADGLGSRVVEELPSSSGIEGGSPSNLVRGCSTRCVVGLVVSVALLVFGILGLTGVLPMATGWAVMMVVLSPVVFLIGCVSCCHKVATSRYGSSERKSAPETRVYDNIDELSAAVDEAIETGQGFSGRTSGV